MDQLTADDRQARLDALADVLLRRPLNRQERRAREQASRARNRRAYRARLTGQAHA